MKEQEQNYIYQDAHMPLQSWNHADNTPKYGERISALI